MTKNQFRILVIFTMLLSILSSVVDQLWVDQITANVFLYSEGVVPELSDNEWLLIMINAVVLAILCIVSFIGLMLFKAWGRLSFLLACIAVLPFYLFSNTVVISPLSQFFYDMANFSSGSVLILIYLSPVAEYFKESD